LNSKQGCRKFFNHQLATAALFNRERRAENRRRRFCALIVVSEMKEVTLSPEERIESLNIKDYKIIQSDALYKFTSDSVILSRFARRGAARVCDLCSGSGIVGLHYFALNDDSVENVTMVELQPSLYEMSKKSVVLNGLEDKFTAVNDDVKNFDGKGIFDLVLCNPPYEKAGAGIPPKSEHLAACKTEVCVTLEDIIAAARRALKAGGAFALCHKSSRLPEIFSLFERYKLSPSRLQFVSGNGGKAYLALIECVKGKKTEMEVYNTVINDFRDFSGQK